LFPWYFFSDGMGGFNNIIKVDQDDLEVFKALEIDIADQKKLRSAIPVEALSDESYGRRVPDLNNPALHTNARGPPILPPQLVHVILNKDTPLNCEPTLLPRPNHVMVNHMYALSIKDQVMALSTTTRYRKKYVTTILYKPV
jgi:5'-AMP-activated protein kinase regulatory beta subunit